MGLTRAYQVGESGARWDSAGLFHYNTPYRFQRFANVIYIVYYMYVFKINIYQLRAGPNETIHLQIPVWVSLCVSLCLHLHYHTAQPILAKLGGHILRLMRSCIGYATVRPCVICAVVRVYIWYCIRWTDTCPTRHLSDQTRVRPTLSPTSHESDPY